MTFKPRYYQVEGVNAVYNHFKNQTDNPCVVIPPGGGKTFLISQIAKDYCDYGGRVLILSHVKELLGQLYSTLTTLLDKDKVGLYSAGLKSRDTQQDVVIAGIQSVYKRIAEFGKFDLVIIDECQLIPEDGDGMYQTLFKECKKINPELRALGTTATPYRMRTGVICKPDNILNTVCYEIGVKELITKGFLCKLTSKSAIGRVDDSSLHILGGEFKFDEMSALYSKEDAIDNAVREIKQRTADRKKGLVFAASKDHGRILAERLGDSRCLFDDTKDRDQILEDFRNNKFKYLVNLEILTIGYDEPSIDFIAICRSTKSPGLYVQIVGRLTRLFDGKKDGLVLDFGNNIERHGPIDSIITPEEQKIGKGKAPVKECPNCQEMVHLSVKVCPDCGYKFPIEDKAPHTGKASDQGITSDEITDHSVSNTWYDLHEKTKDDGTISRTMVVSYETSFRMYQKEWVCFEHTGFAKDKAEHWWHSHKVDPKSKCPDSVQEAIELCENGAVKKPVSIQTKKDGKWTRIINVEYELTDAEHKEKSEEIEELVYSKKQAEDDYEDDDLPF